MKERLLVTAWRNGEKVGARLETWRLERYKKVADRLYCLESSWGFSLEV
jgi:hypothetical protein